ncbi:hypothetical protein KB879_06180 [Cupriavidus sp. KK10]|jgi:hypothetical protein|uniref:hypothetical protein n=1 Tax=Cupriavidus sp. KK10 TaxID=1478019 RepID=UPI001BA87C32|nr:hypothetical protein [Cupriavidus sp. KK10]QUN29532.1 hypothetical protein KB879_06180 [Cupriavidus sp. KK10]
MRVISLAVLIDVATHDYRAKGKVVRVFDQNSQGDLLPVPYQQRGEDNKFRLDCAPAGAVYAEIDGRSQSSL